MSLVRRLTPRPSPILLAPPMLAPLAARSAPRYPRERAPYPLIRRAEGNAIVPCDAMSTIAGVAGDAVGTSRSVQEVGMWSDGPCWITPLQSLLIIACSLHPSILLSLPLLWRIPLCDHRRTPLWHSRRPRYAHILQLGLRFRRHGEFGFADFAWWCVGIGQRGIECGVGGWDSVQSLEVSLPPKCDWCRRNSRSTLP